MCAPVPVLNANSRLKKQANNAESKMSHKQAKQNKRVNELIGFLVLEGGNFVCLCVFGVGFMNFMFIIMLGNEV